MYSIAAAIEIITGTRQIETLYVGKSNGSTRMKHFTKVSGSLGMVHCL